MDTSLIWKTIVVIGSMLVALASSIGIIRWKHPDNPTEQAIEKFIEHSTGYDIDLSADDEIAGI